MLNVRAAALCAVLGLTLFVVGCSGGGGATPPVDTSTVNQNQNPNQTIDNTQPSPDLSTGGVSTMATTTGTIHVHGNITAIISASEFQINGGAGVGYLHIYTNSSTVKTYNGLTPKVGVYADVYATGTLSSGNLTATNLTLSSSSTSSTGSTSGAPAAGTYSIHVHGTITAMISGSEFQLQGGTGVGYVHVYVTSSTAKIYNGLTLKAGDYADVYATGSLSTGTLTAVQLTLSSSSSGSGTTSGAPAAGTYSVHVHGNITAMISASEFQLQGGAGVGYVHVYVTSTTNKIYNGLTLKAGDYADVYATGSLSTGTLTAVQLTLSSSSSGSGTTSPATPAPTGSSSITHVMTAGLYGYGGTSTAVSPASMAPYLTWAQTSPSDAATLRAHGIKVDIYMNFWKNYTSDNPAIGYNDLKPGGAHAAAELKTCSGVVAHESIYGGGYVANAMTSAAKAHAAVVANYRESEYGGNYDAIFSDDTGSLDGDPLPCGYTQSTYIADTNAVHASLGKKVFFNGLNAGTNIVSQVGYANASNVIGGMCESCLSYWATNAAGTVYDAVRQTDKWIADENVEAQMVSKHKIYWAYARAIGNASSETPLRTYVYASFLLTYDPNYAMLQEALKTPSGFEVFPETGFVPTGPLTTYSSVSGYLRSGGAYMREFSACYYRGSAKGRCAVVVNPSYTATVSIPTSAYHHQMTLSGYGVLDGGSASFGSAAPTSLGPGKAAILLP